MTQPTRVAHGSSMTTIIGAGLAGLSAAQVLLDAGHRVTVLDKGRGVGGRLATRRIGDATLDHGAQFFTVRGDDFRHVIARAIEAGVVEVWCHGFGAEDGYPRYRGTDGMNAFAKWLATGVEAAGGSIFTDTVVSSIRRTDSSWVATVDGAESIASEHLIVTAPVPQALTLVRNGEVDLDMATEAELESIRYKPTLALLVTLDGPSAIDAPGGVQRTEDDVFTFIADNQHKGLSTMPALTFHVNGDVSGARWDDDPEIVTAELLAEASQWIGDASVVEAQLKKWRFAGPRIPHPDPFVVMASQPGKLIVAGDAFAGPKVEGAFNSGRAAARHLTSG